MRSLTAKWMAGISSASFVFDDDLATELETYAKANVELLSIVANVALAPGVTVALPEISIAQRSLPQRTEILSIRAVRGGYRI